VAKRSPQTFAKRQKEMARKEKQQEKAAKRLERKHHSKERVEDGLDPDIAHIVPGPQPRAEEELGA
jgi:hypothetical protein